jgi:hypothetical protein
MKRFFNQFLFFCRSKFTQEESLRATRKRGKSSPLSRQTLRVLLIKMVRLNRENFKRKRFSLNFKFIFSPESVKTRNDVFYLQPERSCVPDSPVWYSTQPLSRDALSKMLHRVKMVKEINIALLTS